MKSSIECFSMQDCMSGHYENSYHLFQHCLVCQLVYSKIPFILCDKFYYTIQKYVHKVSFVPYMNPPFTYTNPLENGQVRPKSYIASERPQL